uniref:Uncharacterized protein n=1 Tax=Arundo donax TaxID=35708 RepID=A0A0A9HPH7_ARUDO
MCSFSNVYNPSTAILKKKKKILVLLHKCTPCMVKPIWTITFTFKRSVQLSV